MDKKQWKDLAIGWLIGFICAWAVIVGIGMSLPPGYY